VTNMWTMFLYNLNLEKIYVSEKFTTRNVTSDWWMFVWSTNLVWWNWTTYTWSHIDRSYAVIDDESHPWYFTNILDKSYKITYYLDWWTLLWAKTSYTQRDSFTLPIPIRTWYTFIWWIWSNIMQPQTEMTIQAWTEWNLEFTAKWKLIPEEQEEESTKPSWWWGGWWGWGGGWWGWTPKNTIQTWDVHWVADEIEKDLKNDVDETETEKQDKQDPSEKDNVDTSTKWEKDNSKIEGEYTQEQVDAYTFAKSKWITTTPTIEKAKMNTSLKRIEMAKMLSYYAINVLWQKPDAEKWVVKFNDVTSKLDKQYNNWVTLAYQLWIMWINMKNNNFRPYDEVTRAEFVTALSRMIYWIKDWTWKTKYYEPHMAKLNKEWIITNTNPNLKEKRWYVMLMLMRSAK